MKSDLDTLMREARLDGLLIVGSSSHNPAMAYFVGRSHITYGYLLFRRGQEPILFHASMEREEAARTGIPTHDLSQYPMDEFLRTAEGDAIEAGAMRMARILEQFPVHGRVAVTGNGDAGLHHSLFQRVAELVPGIEFIGEATDRSVVVRARGTKSQDEVDRIRRMGAVTTEVAGLVSEFLRSQRVEQGQLVGRARQPITVGDVKRQISLWVAEREAENPEGTIFAVGRDAGIPHSAGQPADPIPLGTTIVFDFFPCEAGGGYFYDFTRTWCLGHASPEAERAFEDVRQVYRSAITSLRAGASCRGLQVQTCEEFRRRGHVTIRENPQTQEGYVHGLGHGVGLAIHESPWLSHSETNRGLLAPGAVVTIEPGLYYPERGFGIRIEDTWWIRPDGTAEVLAEFPDDLVLRMKLASRSRTRRRTNGHGRPSGR